MASDKQEDLVAKGSYERVVESVCLEDLDFWEDPDGERSRDGLADLTEEQRRRVVDLWCTNYQEAIDDAGDMRYDALCDAVDEVRKDTSLKVSPVPPVQPVTADDSALEDAADALFRKRFAAELDYRLDEDPQAYPLEELRAILSAPGAATVGADRAAVVDEIFDTWYSDDWDLSLGQAFDKGVEEFCREHRHLVGNTRISYLYRDAGNWKTYNEAVVAGRLTPTEVDEICGTCLIDGEYFVPSMVGLDEDKSMSDDDGGLFEVDAASFDVTREKPRGTVKGGMTAKDLLTAFREERDSLKWSRPASISVSATVAACGMSAPETLYEEATRVALSAPGESVPTKETVNTKNL